MSKITLTPNASGTGTFTIQSPATDWTANSDVTMSGEMRTYRQALRDVPAQEGFPHDVTWPTKP